MVVTSKQLYEMSVDLSVLESLGINLYSNAAAVLSELVANAYDADSTLVDIQWKKTGATIVVSDNGVGMTVQELNERFLKVGYKKRPQEGSISDVYKRPFMGRKGIGKLSVFSIAKRVEVFSTKDGRSNGFTIEVKGLEASIKAGLPYHPKETPVPDEFKHRGTVIRLSNLKSKRASITATALRKRLARRFDVLHQKKESEGGFYMEVNGTRITYADRQELKNLEFIWEFGDPKLPAIALPNGVTRFATSTNVVNERKGWKVTGWFGTARRPTDLTADEDAGSLKNIIVLARKRPIQEGIIEKLDFSRIFGNYVTGQIEADFLDLDDAQYEDIATSDRQRLIEDDERVLALQKFLRGAFLKAADDWSDARPKKVAKDLLAQYPKLKEWVDGRPERQQEPARKMLGTIASLEIEKKTDPEYRTTLFRSGILAFERVGLRETSEALDKLGTLGAADLLPLLGAQEVYESALWDDILRSRINAISKFRDLRTMNAKERVLQEHLFGHLWLLDPSWERATEDQHMEEDIRKLEPDFVAKDSAGKLIKGRLDIRYKTASGQHIIVELKRYSVKQEITTYADQGLKYYEALSKVLRKRKRSTENIQMVFVLGDHPKTSRRGALSEEEFIENTLAPMHGRYVLYDELIDNARRQYQDYLDASDKAEALDTLLDEFSKSVKMTLK